jgi:hypothetical protein
MFNARADWRTANVSPVYKKGLKSAAENYRPISLTSVFCKILEHIIARNIMQHSFRFYKLFFGEFRICWFTQHSHRVASEELKHYLDSQTMT